MESLVFILFLLTDPAGDGTPQGVLVAASQSDTGPGAAAIVEGFRRDVSDGSWKVGERAVELSWKPGQGMDTLAGKAPAGTAYTVALTCRDGCSAAIMRNGTGGIRTIEQSMSAADVGVVAARVLRTMMTLPPVVGQAPSSETGNDTVMAIVAPQTGAPSKFFTGVAAGAAFARATPDPSMIIGAGCAMNDHWAVVAELTTSFLRSTEFASHAPGRTAVRPSGRLEEGESTLTPYALDLDVGPAFVWKTGPWAFEAAAGVRLSIDVFDATRRDDTDTGALVHGGIWAAPSVQYRFADRFFAYSSFKASLLPVSRTWEQAGAHFETPLFEGVLSLGAGCYLF